MVHYYFIINRLSFGNRVKKGQRIFWVIKKGKKESVIYNNRIRKILLASCSFVFSFVVCEWCQEVLKTLA